MSFNVGREGFPIVTTKKIHWKSIVVELLWFLRGEVNVKFLHEHDVTIWDEWANKHGDVGPVYGHLWRYFEGVDQIAEMITRLRSDRFSRRNVVTAWHPALVSKQRLPCCHILFQTHCRVKGGVEFLDITVYQRSADIFLGVPFNISSYALLLCLIANEVNMRPGRLTMMFGNLHLYVNHEEVARFQLQRPTKTLPDLIFPEDTRIMTKEDARLINPNSIMLPKYDPWGPIKAEVAV